MMRTATLVASVTLAGAWATPFAHTAEPVATVITASRLLDVKSGTYRTGQAIVIEGERITAVGALADLRHRAPTVIDLGAVTLMPGLIDCHSHLLSAMAGRLGAGEAIVLTVTGLGKSSRALLGAAMAREVLEAGFTTVRNVGHSGVDGDAALRGAIAAGWVPGPRMFAATRKITPIGGQAVEVRSEHGDSLIAQEFLPISGAVEARRAVREAQRDGADVIKVVVDDGTRALGADELQAIAEESHRAGMKVAAHATTVNGIQAAIDGGVDSIEHGDAATDAMLDAMKRKGIFLVLTRRTLEGIRDILLGAGGRRPAPSQQAAIDRQLTAYVAASRAFVERVVKSGVRVAFGSDMWDRYPARRAARQR